MCPDDHDFVCQCRAWDLDFQIVASGACDLVPVPLHLVARTSQIGFDVVGCLFQLAGPTRHVPLADFLCQLHDVVAKAGGELD